MFSNIPDRRMDEVMVFAPCREQRLLPPACRIVIVPHKRPPHFELSADSLWLVLCLAVQWWVSRPNRTGPGGKSAMVPDGLLPTLTGCCRCVGTSRIQLQLPPEAASACPPVVVEWAYSRRICRIWYNSCVKFHLVWGKGGQNPSCPGQYISGTWKHSRVFLAAFITGVGGTLVAAFDRQKSDWKGIEGWMISIEGLIRYIIAQIVWVNMNKHPQSYYFTIWFHFQQWTIILTHSINISSWILNFCPLKMVSVNQQ